MTDVGTLKELGVKPGDVVECIDIGTKFQFNIGKKYKVEDFAGIPYVNGCVDSIQNGECDWKFRIISRAADTPKLWRDMTPEEKGALLLAHHEGKVIQNASKWVNWGDCSPSWDDGIAYRVKPEPEVETVTGCYWEASDGIHCFSGAKFTHATHRITFNLINGKPDPASIRMESL